MYVDVNAERSKKLKSYAVWREACIENKRSSMGTSILQKDSVLI